jgi:adenylate kinase family enzyme
MITGLPVVHLDAYYWRSGWNPTPEEEWRRRVGELVAAERWVMDGNYGGTLDLRLAACDTVVFLDLPRRITIPRVIRRWLRYRSAARPDVAPGCPDRLTFEFLAWIWNYPRARRPQVLRKLRALPNDRAVHVLSSRKDVEAFLARIDKSPA